MDVNMKEQVLDDLLGDSSTRIDDDASRDRLSRYISAVGNFGIQYNFHVISVALVFMDNGDDDDNMSSAFPRTEHQSQAVKSVAFAGAVVGQLCMGYVGDWAGRRKAMIITNTFTAIGALGCALFAWGSADQIYTIITACRFLLGVGVGGKYPLTATIRNEGVAKEQHASTEVAKGFFWQSPGSMAPYVVATIIVAAFGQKEGEANYDSVSLQFRLLFIIGAIPAVAVAVMTFFTTESREFEKRKHENPIFSALQHPEHWNKLMGTGMAWLIYDFVTYGTSINMPTILNAVFGKSETLLDNCWQNIVLKLVGLPGVLLAIYQLEGMGTKALQNWGFVAVAVASVALAAAFQANKDNHTLLFTLLCVLIITLGWGVNISTYVLPTEEYPIEVRSTFFGLSAAMGKVGALLGTYAFQPISDKWGFSGTYLVCAVISVLGVLCTHQYVTPFGKHSFFRAKGAEYDGLGGEDEDDDEGKGESVLRSLCTRLRQVLHEHGAVTQENAAPLRRILDGLLPRHVGLSAGGGDGTIRYLHVHEEEGFSMGVLVLPPNAQIPLHDHPGMSALSRILYGGLSVRSFDFLKATELSEAAQDMIAESGGRWATPRDAYEVQGPYTTALFPDWANIHEFTAGESGCAIFDVLTPPYNTSNRDCTYFVETEMPADWIDSLQLREKYGQMPLILKDVVPDDFEVLLGIYRGETMSSEFSTNPAS